jgi:hypothetical protein
MMDVYTLPEQIRIDNALMQYSARQYGGVDYHIREIVQNGRWYYQSEVESCSECKKYARNVVSLIEHCKQIPHIAEVYQLKERALTEQLNSYRHDAIRYIVKAYRSTTRRMLDSNTLLETVIGIAEEELQRHTHRLILPQLESLIAVLQLHTPDYYKKTKEFWIVRLLAAQ